MSCCVFGYFDSFGDLVNGGVRVICDIDEVGIVICDKCLVWLLLDFVLSVYVIYVVFFLVYGCRVFDCI